jgi:sec-independent protein translocase protein TatB
MIDIGLTKIALIGVVALIVIGPEKLPRVARTAGTLFGRAQRYLNQVKAEVGREMELDELRKMQQQVMDAASSVEQSISENLQETQASLHAALHEGVSSESGDLPSADDLARRMRTFRKKRLARNSAIPAWYKNQQGRRTRVISGAARVARYRPASAGRKSAPFFH